ncbi:hypothetical protein HJG60_008341 [Phyllostomus discolor]|uniref:Uncharacterized protein n=1 Tax=Phyllostomus discolor TaxID=89673 RepID=A0A833Z1L5_9CHIR|nr:hypothetical protein HJG60_008341 [Phyllostomus discolor]
MAQPRPKRLGRRPRTPVQILFWKHRGLGRPVSAAVCWLQLQPGTPSHRRRPFSELREARPSLSPTELLLPVSLGDPQYTLLVLRFNVPRGPGVVHSCSRPLRASGGSREPPPEWGQFVRESQASAGIWSSHHREAEKKDGPERKWPLLRS